MNYLIALISLFLFFATPARAEVMGKALQESQFYFLIDADTKEVLLSKNADIRIAPSSMTKLMTAYVVFDQIQKGKISFDSQCLIGKDAWRKSGSSMFLNYGDVVSIDKLLQGLLAVSGNDAAIALAESSAGGINNFVNLMNLRARELGLKNSQFRNPHGLNEEGHYMSLRDLAMLAIHLNQDFPQYSHYFGIPEFTYHNITQHNRNPLIKENYDGVVGGKTGHTNEGGYGVVGIVKRNHRRLIAVVNKSKTPKQRSAALIDLFDYGFHNYKKLVLFGKNHTVAQLPIWLGSKSKVDAVTDQEISFNIPSDRPLDAVSVKVKYKKPIYAPLKSHEKIADLVIEIKGYKNLSYPLFAKEEIDKAGPLKRITQILRYKIRIFYNKFFS
ncbi:MAG: D-alanyl-D-alanine carboxypeptidase [Proteobacteria bacterium]|nr:D-alanyl-D-alanine carboxypeptidase [Pseudomonadota bacterium]